MAQGLFVQGFTVAEVLAIQKVAKDNLIAGTMQTSWSLGESSSGSVPSMSTMQVLDECKYALEQLDPATYKKITRLRANFSGGYPHEFFPGCTPGCEPPSCP